MSVGKEPMLGWGTGRPSGRGMASVSRGAMQATLGWACRASRIIMENEPVGKMRSALQATIH